jgi:hypothetical protein
MKNIKILLAAIISLLPATSFAVGLGDGRLGVQAGYNLGTASGTSIGVVHYWNNFEGGITGGYASNNVTGSETKIGNVGAFAGLRHSLDQGSWFAWGANFQYGFGTISGRAGYKPIQVGPYVALEHMLGNSILVAAWINPYLYRSEKDDVNTVATVTSSFFTTGGIGFSYLF